MGGRHGSDRIGEIGVRPDKLPDEDERAGVDKLVDDLASRRVALLEPPILMHELASVLAVAVKRGRIAAEDASLAWRSFSEIGILFRNPENGGDRLIRLSLLPGVSAYDASYACLAEEYGCAFYTADGKLEAALRGQPVTVRPIAAYM